MWRGSGAERVDTMGFESVSEATDLVCIRTMVHGDRPEDSVALDNLSHGMFHSVTRSTPVNALGFRGLLIEGNSKSSKFPQTARVFVVGNSLVVGLVTHKGPGFDAANTTRFLEACRFEIPWRLYPWPAAGLVVAMPSYAIELDESALNLPEYVQGRSFYLGGEHSLVFWLAASPVEREDPNVTDDQLLEESIQGLESTNARIITRSPVEFRGARGVDLLFETQKQHARWRMLITATRLYQIGVYAKDKQALLQPEAKRFIESVRWNGDE